jgi:hypothetical protein
MTHDAGCKVNVSDFYIYEAVFLKQKKNEVLIFKNTYKT